MIDVSLGTATGSTTGPKFIFGRLNSNWRASEGGDDQATRAILDRLTAALQKRLGRKPTPTEVQVAYRRQVVAQARGRILAAMMAKNGGKVPTPDQFVEAMDRWREQHLADTMAAANRALGTEGIGPVHARRAGWRRRLQAALREAARRTAASQRQRETTQGTSTKPASGTSSTGYQLVDLLTQAHAAATAGTTQKATLSLENLAERTAQRVQRRLAAFLDDQRAEIVKRLEARGEAIARKPADDSVWWDGDKWDRELQRLIEPIVESLHDMAADRVTAQLPAPGKAAPADPYKRTLQQVLRHAGARVKGINATTRREIAGIVRTGIREGVTAAELGRRISEATTFDSNRAETIARTETGTALNQAQVEAYRSHGVERVRVLDGTADEVCASANGQVWTLDEAAGAPLGHPNCVRDFVPVFGPEAGGAE